MQYVTWAILLAQCSDWLSMCERAVFELQIVQTSSTNHLANNMDMLKCAENEHPMLILLNSFNITGANKSVGICFTDFFFCCCCCSVGFQEANIKSVNEGKII